VLLVNFVLLAAFLRSLGAPLYLLASSVLAVTAALGITTWLMETVLGHALVAHSHIARQKTLYTGIQVTGLVWSSDVVGLGSSSEEEVLISDENGRATSKSGLLRYRCVFPRSNG